MAKLGTLKIVNRHGYQETDNQFVYGGRGTPLGNPFKGDIREHNIANFTEYLANQIQAERPTPAYREIYYIARLLRHGVNVDLACSCKPRACHLDVVETYIQSIIANPPPYTVTIVGSRKTPDNVLDYTARLSTRLQELGIRVRTGDAMGMDAAARASNKYLQVFVAAHATEDRAAHDMAERYHPAWQNVRNHYVRSLHARSCFQVLGMSLHSPSDAMVCWTPDGCESHQTRRSTTGGSGTSISIASESGVPVFNLANEGAMARFYELLGTDGKIDLTS